MPEPEEITPELREKIEPHLKDRLGEELWGDIDEMFSKVVYTQPGDVPYVTLFPCGYFPAMQFSCVTGEFMELTNWSYILTVDTDEQTAERERREALETLVNVLKHYHKQEFVLSTDYEAVIKNRKEIQADGYVLYEYDCPAQTIYLDETMYPVTYGKQMVLDDWYYYNFSDNELTDTHNITEIDLYNYRVPYEWKRYNVDDG